MSISFQGSLLGGNEFFWGDAEELGQNSKNSQKIESKITWKTLLSNICRSLP